MFTTIEQRITAGSNFDATLDGCSTGSITTVAASNLVQGETFTLRSRLKYPVVFEIDFQSAVVETDTHRAVKVSSGMTSTQVRDAIIQAVTRASALALYASAGGAATVTLTNAAPGTAGNHPAVADTVANGTFAVSAMSGGTDPSFEVVDGVKYIASSTHGGIFDFPFAGKRVTDGIPSKKVTSWIVERLLIDFANASAHTVSALLPDGTSIALATGSGGKVYLTNLVLAGDERIAVTSTGASQAMVGRVTARPKG